jgi:hypothetical protein
MAMDQSMTEKQLTLADLHLVYAAACKAAESKRTTKTTEKVDKIDFEAFLTCLIKIAKKCYPSNRTEEEAMQQLLMDNILPLASRRKPVTIEVLLRQSNIENIFKYYEEALKELYKFYTTSAALTNKGNNLQRSVRSSHLSFDDQRESFEETRGKSREESSEHQMSYSDFIRFSNDFGMVTTLSITTMDLGDIYLTTTFFNNFTPRLRRISFMEFWEVMVRCALVAFQDKKSLTSEIKIKGLFLSIWRHIQSSAADHMNGYGTIAGGGFNTYKGALLRGTQLLNEKFVAAWTKDNYCDYLAPLVAPSPEGTPKKAGTGPSANESRSAVPAMSSTISKLLRPASDADMTKGNRDRSETNSSQRGRTLTFDRSGGLSMDVPRSSAEILREDIMMKVGVDNISQCDNFLVPVPLPARLKAEEKAKLEPGFIRVKINDHDEFDDTRLKVQDLRALLQSKPHIAELLYDALVEENLVEDERIRQIGDDRDDKASAARMRLSSLHEIDVEDEDHPLGVRNSVAGRSSMVIGDRSSSIIGGNLGMQLKSMTEDSEFNDDDGDVLRIEDLEDEMLR